MQASTILYEPLPIGRIGIRLEDEEVVIASDFSTSAFMLEEYISLAATKIAIPKPAPEIKQLSQMPVLLRDRIQVLDDSSEQEAVERLMHSVLTELGCKIEGESRNLKFPNNLDPKLCNSVNQVYRDIFRLAVGFNHSVQIGIHPESTYTNIRYLRQWLRNTDARVLLAQIEGILSVYSEIKYDSIKPSIDIPQELISVFDRLVNDNSYLALSETVGELAQPNTRQYALVKLRGCIRTLASNSKIVEGWNYVSKIINVWTGIPIPGTGALTAFSSSQTLPAFINLNPARQRAVEMWVATGNSQPCNRAGTSYTNEEIYWLPPLKSIRAGHPDALFYRMGTVGELQQELENAVSSTEFTRLSKRTTS